MTPKEVIDGMLEDRRRRFQDRPEMMLLQSLWWVVKIVLGLVITWGAIRLGGVLVEFKPMKEVQAKQTAVLEKICDVQAQHTTDIQVLKERTTNLERRFYRRSDNN